MSTVTQFLHDTLEPLIVIFAASNMAVMGLQTKAREVLATLTQPKILVAVFLWGWVLGPAVAVLIAWTLPLSDPFVIGLLLTSLCPVAPFVPLMVPIARGDMSFAGALVPLVAIYTVVFTPLIAPLLIDEVALSAWDIAKMLFLTVLLPLAVGSALRSNAEAVAMKIFTPVNVIAKLSALATVVYALALYWQEMLDTAGSFGLLSQTIFMVVMGMIAYQFGFGLNQNQRSVMSLGMLTRNGAVVMLAAFTIPNVDPSLVTYVVLLIIWSLVLAVIAARILGKLAGENIAENTT